MLALATAPVINTGQFAPRAPLHSVPTPRTVAAGGSPRVVIVHDYVTQRGGAERVVLDLLRAFPGSRLVTSCYQPETTYPEFAQYDVETILPDRLGLFQRDPRRAFPFLAKAFSEHVITDADVVVCSSSGWAHRVTTTAPKIVYCHAPARWIYQPTDYFGSRVKWAQRGIAAVMSKLRRSDAVAAHESSRYISNSTAVAQRVHEAYGIKSTIVHPARGLSPEGPQEPVEGVEPGFLLTVSRQRGYKHTEVICDAVASMDDERLVVVGGPATESENPAITRVSGLTDAQMRWLYANAAGLVAVAHEDFGLTPTEAQAFGTPAVLLRAGGYLDSTVENVTGVFVDGITPELIAAGIADLRSRAWDAAAIRRAGERFSRETFAKRMNRIVDEVIRPLSPVTMRAARTPRAAAAPRLREFAEAA